MTLDALLGQKLGPKLETVRPFSHVVPRRRNRRGEPLPRSFVSTRPLVTLDPEALLETAEAHSVDPEEARRRLPWLKARNAIAASDNAVRLREEIEGRVAAERAEAKVSLVALEPRREEAKAEVERLEAKLAEVSAPLGLKDVAGRTSLDFEEGEPCSLEELAGRYNLPPPEERAGWAYRTGYKLLAGVGGGAVFGISLGLLTGKLELFSLSEEWPWLVLWAALGMTVMALAGAALHSLSQTIGCGLSRLGRKHAWLGPVELWLTAAFLAGLAIAVVLIESKVEQLGLFKAIGEQSSLHGFRLGQGELAWVSMMLVIPTVSCYIVLGVREGRRRANLSHLQGLLGHWRQKMRETQLYAEASALLVKVNAAQRRADELTRLTEAERSRSRSEPSAEEKERLEDLEMDAVAASWEAEDVLAAVPAVGASTMHRQRPSWCRRLVNLFGGKGRHSSMQRLGPQGAGRSR